MSVQTKKSKFLSLKSVFVFLVFIFTLFLVNTNAYAYLGYCPIPAGDSCTGCHSTPGTNGWPACPPSSTNWTINASAGAGGSISPSGGVTVTSGGSQQFTITPTAGYIINEVLVDGASVGPQTVYTFTNVTANHTISASFFSPAEPPPMADFLMTPLTTTDPYIVSFTDLSTDGPTSWLWDFGDGVKSSQQDPSHGYLSPGTYTVTLEAINRNGSDIISQNINVSFTACPNGEVDLGGWRQTSTQAAYDSAVNGEVIMIQARGFDEDIILDQNKSVTLSGGYDCNYTMNPAASYISSLTISGGTAIVENITIHAIQSLPSLDGTTLYADNCANCHGELANSTKIPTTTTAVQLAIDSNIGGMGYLNFLTPEEVQAIVDTLNAQTPPSQSCTSCHGQPPNGSSFPNTAGAHIAHDPLGFGSTVPSCNTCHVEATHLNGTADISVASGFDAQSGSAVVNGDGTCSSIRCHGGQNTPSWSTGTLNVNTQCTSCHTRRTSGDSFPDQYNDYYSGEHRRHVVSEGYACTVCHNTAVLAVGHFSNLESSGFEQDPANTIGGGSTEMSNGSWNPVSQTCTLTCHGEGHQNENW